MTPSEVLDAELKGENFTGMFGCAEIETAAYCVVSYLSFRNYDWDVSFNLSDVRTRFLGTDEQWLIFVCHRHAVTDTRNCMLTDWLINEGAPDKWSVTSEFVTRVTRGRASLSDPVNAARVRLYVKIARETPGLTFDDVQLTYQSRRGSYSALVKGFRVSVDDDQLVTILNELGIELDTQGIDSVTEPDRIVICGDYSMSAEKIENGFDNDDARSEMIAEILASEWRRGQ